MSIESAQAAILADVKAALLVLDQADLAADISQVIALSRLS